MSDPKARAKIVRVVYLPLRPVVLAIDEHWGSRHALVALTEVMMVDNKPAAVRAFTCPPKTFHLLKDIEGEIHHVR